VELPQNSSISINIAGIRGVLIFYKYPTALRLLFSSSYYPGVAGELFTFDPFSVLIWILDIGYSILEIFLFLIFYSLLFNLPYHGISNNDPGVMGVLPAVSLEVIHS
jgi:hypothetical protein